MYIKETLANPLAIPRTGYVGKKEETVTERCANNKQLLTMYIHHHWH